MDNNQEHIRRLLNRFAQDEATEDEIREMLAGLREEKGDAALESFLEELFAEAKSNPSSLPVDWEKVWNHITKSTRQASVKKMNWTKIAAAAVIVIMLSVSGYFYFVRPTQKEIVRYETPRSFKNDVTPGGDKAVLTLSNGTQIILDSTANGIVSQQGNTKIIKLNSGEIAYNLLNEKPAEDVYNTISTPKGGQYQVVLSDGSKVWLNAASSLRFPASFNRKERKVELTGEGYFEVAHDASAPFHVSVNGADVQVLGTHFNINSYDDEAFVKTTLLLGSVKVSKGAFGKIIKPGEQALTSSSRGGGREEAIMVQTVDVSEAVAWKNGRFIFSGNNIQFVMRQLARWYNVEVSYEGNIPDEQFVGVINRSRYENISQILEMLEKTRTVSFIIKGQNITVMPYNK